MTDIDPVQSFNANKVNLQSGNEAYDEDDEGVGGVIGGAGEAQCKQMCLLLFSRFLSSVMSALLQMRSRSRSMSSCRVASLLRIWLTP